MRRSVDTIESLGRIASTARARPLVRPTSARTGAGTITRDPLAAATASTAAARRRLIPRSLGVASTESASESSTTVVGSGVAGSALRRATTRPLGRARQHLGRPLEFVGSRRTELVLQLADELDEVLAFELVTQRPIDKAAETARSDALSDGGEDLGFDSGGKSLTSHSGRSLPLCGQMFTTQLISLASLR